MKTDLEQADRLLLDRIEQLEKEKKALQVRFDVRKKLIGKAMRGAKSVLKIVGVVVISMSLILITGYFCGGSGIGKFYNQNGCIYEQKEWGPDAKLACHLQTPPTIEYLTKQWEQSRPSINNTILQKFKAVDVMCAKNECRVLLDDGERIRVRNYLLMKGDDICLFPGRRGMGTWRPCDIKAPN